MYTWAQYRLNIIEHSYIMLFTSFSPTRTQIYLQEGCGLSQLSEFHCVCVDFGVKDTYRAHLLYIHIYI